MQTMHAHLSVSEAAHELGVSADTIRRWDKAGRLKSFRTPTNHRRFLRADIEALREGGRSA